MFLDLPAFIALAVVCGGGCFIIAAVKGWSFANAALALIGGLFFNIIGVCVVLVAAMLDSEGT